VINKASVVKTSYLLVLLVLFTVAWFKIQTTFITVLFSYFLLSIFGFFAVKFLRSPPKPWFPIAIFIIVVVAIFYAFVVFIREAIETLPEIARNSIPIAADYAKRYNIELPFTDVTGLRDMVVHAVKKELHEIAKFAELATKEFVYLILGLVVAISIFINGKLDLDEDRYPLKNNLYSVLCKEISTRFRNFYHSFETVMGAQIIISTINTFFTGLFVFAIGLPYAKMVTITTFLCGLLPIIGNLISNTVITFIGMTVSLRMAVFALIFLIILHKFEYFLNSKIIGGKIKNPMWLTLLSLIVGERVMGIPGMILAPVILHYIKLEGSQTEVKI
jgi:predicted PurR-regulated permease PerM